MESLAICFCLAGMLTCGRPGCRAGSHRTIRCGQPARLVLHSRSGFPGIHGHHAGDEIYNESNDCHYEEIPENLEEES